MSAYMSRGKGVLVKLRVEHRLSLEEVALLLSLCSEDTGEELPLAAIRDAVSVALRMGGADAVVEAQDIQRGADYDDERMAWCRASVARAYRRDFAKFPDEMAAFEAGDAL